MLNILMTQVEKLEQAARLLLAPSSYCSIPAVFACLLFAAVFLLIRHWRRRGHVRFAVVVRALVMSRRIVGHRSNAADVFYYLINTFAIGGLIGWGMFSATHVAGLAVHRLTKAFGHHAPVAAFDWVVRTGITVVGSLAMSSGIISTMS